MKNEKNIEKETDRREALKTLGKYSAYVAPFTVMAISAKAATVTGTGGKAVRAKGK